MTLVVRLVPGVEERVDFVLSPMVELLSSLHVLRAPEHHPLNHGYVRDVRGRPAALKRDLARFAFAAQGVPTAVGLPLVGVDRASFADELAVLRRATDVQATAFFTRAHWLMPGEPAAGPSLPAERFFGDVRGPRASLALAERAVYRPREMLLAFADVVERLWHAAFYEQWQRELPKLEAEILEARERLTQGIATFLRPLWPEVRVDERGRAFSVERIPEHGHEVVIGPGNRLRLVPSAFVWPHVRVYCDRPGEVVLLYTPSMWLARVVPVRPPSKLVALLAALADETRLQMLYFLGRRPRSTQELSALVGVSASTLSKHLRRLEGAGIVRSKRRSYYVFYELAIDLDELLSVEINSYLGQPEENRPMP